MYLHEHIKPCCICDCLDNCSDAENPFIFFAILYGDTERYFPREQAGNRDDAISMRADCERLRAFEQDAVAAEVVQDSGNEIIAGFYAQFNISLIDSRDRISFFQPSIVIVPFCHSFLILCALIIRHAQASLKQ